MAFDPYSREGQARMVHEHHQAALQRQAIQQQTQAIEQAANRYVGNPNYAWDVSPATHGMAVQQQFFEQNQREQHENNVRSLETIAVGVAAYALLKNRQTQRAQAKIVSGTFDWAKSIHRCRRTLGRQLGLGWSIQTVIDDAAPVELENGWYAVGVTVTSPKGTRHVVWSTDGSAWHWVGDDDARAEAAACEAAKTDGSCPEMFAGVISKLMKGTPTDQGLITRVEMDEGTNARIVDDVFTAGITITFSSGETTHATFTAVNDNWEWRADAA